MKRAGEYFCVYLRCSLSKVVKPVVFLIFLLPYLNYAEATSVVAIRTPSQVVVGTDSLNVPVDNIGENESFLACKIFHHGTIYYTFSGIISDEPSNFNIRLIAEEALKTEGAMADKLMKFETLILSKLKRFSKNLIKDPDPKPVIVKAMFFGIENDVPFLYVRRYRYTVGASGFGTILRDPTDCPGKTCTDSPTGINLTVLGLRTEIDKILSTGYVITDSNAIKTVKRFIEAQIVADPGHKNVSPPIDIIKIDRTGIHWIQRKKDCY